MPTPNIAIIGAGPAGLTLATLLQRAGMDFTIFELDSNSHTRDQGGSVDLHGDSGQLALREAGLFPAFQAHARPAAEAMKLVKSDGTVCWDESSGSNNNNNNNNNNDKEKTSPQANQSRDRPEIDRGALRDILLAAVPPTAIQWNRKLARVEPTGEKYTLHFTDGSESSSRFDLVVGADGAWSRVRPLLTDAIPHYSGVTIVQLNATAASTTHAWLAGFTGAGSCFMFDEGRSLVCQRQEHDAIRVYAGVRVPETWSSDCGIEWTRPESARADFIERYFGDCHADIKRVIGSAGADGLKPWPLFMLPVGLKWAPRQGVTLLGDAAHLMTPFAGVGVNVALTDALDLAKALSARKEAFEADVPGTLAAAIQEYEGAMFERAKENMEKSAAGLKGHFSANGIEDRLRKLQLRQKMMEERARKMEEASKTA